MIIALTIVNALILLMTILSNIRAVYLLKRTRMAINSILSLQIETANLIPKIIVSSLSVLLSEDEVAKSALREMIKR